MAGVKPGNFQRVLVVALCVVTAALFVCPAAAQTGSGEAERREAARVAAIKAGMVVNFLRYTSWPASAFKDTEDRKAPIVLTLAGDTGLASALSDAVKGVKIDGREIELRQAQYPTPRQGEAVLRQEDVDAYHASLKNSHAVFFGKSEANRAVEALGKLGAADVLTMSDLGGFAEAGGMLALAVREKRVAIDANEDAVKATGLKLSSRLLKLAKIVTSAVERDERRRERESGSGREGSR